jgi:hypothetical protein
MEYYHLEQFIKLEQITLHSQSINSQLLRIQAEQ